MTVILAITPEEIYARQWWIATFMLLVFVSQCYKVYLHRITIRMMRRFLAGQGAANDAALAVAKAAKVIAVSVLTETKQTLTAVKETVALVVDPVRAITPSGFEVEVVGTLHQKAESTLANDPISQETLR